MRSFFSSIPRWALVYTGEPQTSTFLLPKGHYKELRRHLFLRLLNSSQKGAINATKNSVGKIEPVRLHVFFRAQFRWLFRLNTIPLLHCIKNMYIDLGSSISAFIVPLCLISDLRSITNCRSSWRKI